MMAIVPLLMLGLLAATCLVASAEWRGGTTMLLGSGEEASAAHAIVTAASIDPDAVTARNPAVDASIMKEVEKAEKEQVLTPPRFYPCFLVFLLVLSIWYICQVDSFLGKRKYFEQ